MSHVSIATLSVSRFPTYNLASLVELWRARGITVSIGKRFNQNADLGLLHYDRSRIDPATVPPGPKGRPVLNGKVLDITKRALSTLEVRRDDGWDGPVIVKSNLNHFGMPERRPETSDRAASNRRRMAEISWRSARLLPHRTYPVLDHTRLVPHWVWDDPACIVERLVTEREGKAFVLRGWLFLGDIGTGWIITSNRAMVRLSSSASFRVTEDHPAELQEIRRRLGFDFGKFDYVIQDGKPVVFDFNKTPGLHGIGMGPGLRKISQGIDSYLA